jgi:hypothetical protein
MRRLLVVIAVLWAVAWSSGSAWAAPPTHESTVTKNNTSTIAPLPQCPAPGVASVDLAYSEQTHLIFTDTSFHFTDTSTGTLTARAADGSVVSTGHFVSIVNDQGPGFPRESFTAVVNATITLVNGTRTTVHILDHFTITPDGTVTSAFEKVLC